MLITVEATAGTGLTTNHQSAKPNYLAEYIAFRYQELQVAMQRKGLIGLTGWLFKRTIGMGIFLTTSLTGLVILICIILSLVVYPVV